MKTNSTFPTVTNHKGCTLLVVDDNKVFNETLSRSLSRREIIVLSALSAEEALSLLDTQVIDAAVVDLKMDGASGLSLIPKLKANNANCAIVMLTGYASIATAVEAIKLGATNYLTKPANTDDILATLFPAEHSKPTPLTEEQNATMSVGRVEWEHIQKVLSENEGNISATARELGMHRRTLQRKLQKHPVKR